MWMVQEKCLNGFDELTFFDTKKKARDYISKRIKEDRKHLYDCGHYHENGLPEDEMDYENWRVNDIAEELTSIKHDESKWFYTILYETKEIRQGEQTVLESLEIGAEGEKPTHGKCIFTFSDTPLVCGAHVWILTYPRRFLSQEGQIDDKGSVFFSCQPKEILNERFLLLYRLKGDQGSMYISKYIANQENENWYKILHDEWELEDDENWSSWGHLTTFDLDDLEEEV